MDDDVRAVFRRSAGFDPIELFGARKLFGARNDETRARRFSIFTPG
jgi:hypothetical protein